MRNKILFILVLLIIFLILMSRNKTVPMVNPAVAPLPSATINQPKEMKYDSSTDLKKELDSVNPEVLDKDFGT